jgi:hypothetical protein
LKTHNIKELHISHYIHGYSFWFWHEMLALNENHSTLSFTHTTKQRTNNFSLFEGSLVSVQKGKQKITK